MIELVQWVMAVAALIGEGGGPAAPPAAGQTERPAAADAPVPPVPGAGPIPGPGPIPGAGAEPARSLTPPGTRVIVRLGRASEVRGRIEFEDHDLIAIRDLDGAVASHSKTRVLEVTRLVDPAPGQRGMVVLRNGQVREGVLIEDAFDYVMLDIEGIRTRLEREVVSHAVLEPTFEQRYAEFRAAIAPGMVERHLALCRWLVEERRYDLAESELRELLAAADSSEARSLLTIVRAQRALGEPAAPPAPAEATAGAPGSADLLEAGADPGPLISRDDVNVMRVYEIDFNHPPKVQIAPEVIRALIESYGTSPLIPAAPAERTALYSADPLTIVRLMFDLRARDLYPRINVLSEPHALNLFRQRVHNTWLMNSCATSRCHGGPHAGELMLHRRNARDDRVRMTNLLILERLTLDEEFPLINYEEPAMSLVLQYALPREVARKAHPDVKGWAPVFRRPSDRYFREAIGWIESMMYPRPVYPVAYDPPRPRAAPSADGSSEPDR